jgi:hypothetical protein
LGQRRDSLRSPDESRRTRQIGATGSLRRIRTKPGGARFDHRKNRTR